MKVLVFSTLFPNGVSPAHGIFVARRIQQLVLSASIDVRVVAPVPWFPSRHSIFGRYSKFAEVPQAETLYGMQVLHPRYVLIPKIGMYCAPISLALAALATIKRLVAGGFEFDVIDAHYYFPDGIAAVLLGRWLRKPVVITARGSDITQIAQRRMARKIVLWAERQVAVSIAVCQALRNEMQKLGIPRERVVVLRNGVDLDVFRPKHRASLRDAHGWTGTVLISVGLLIERKGHDLVIRALAILPADFSLVIVGSGPSRSALEAICEKLGLAHRVHFLGERCQDELVNLYNAADMLVLASSREGMANVLLESLACGTPVVTTAAGGAREVVSSSDAGVVIGLRTPQAIAQACLEVQARRLDRTRVRLHAERFSWGTTATGAVEVLSQAAGLRA